MAQEATTPDPADQPVVISSRGPLWLRRYPPLLLLVVCLLIAALILPSALNLPQANPSTVLEYAPVPPEDDNPPPSSEGAISTLGLGSSSGLSTGAGPGGGAATAGTGTKPTTKRCVGKPARQTEDPNAPPCVPFFEGDNGGATWQGVQAEEFTVLIYATAHTFVDENPAPDTQGTESTPAAGTYCDIETAPNSNAGCLARVPGGGQSKGVDHTFVKVARAYSRYFNDRFQTYGRKAHLWIYWSSGTQSPATRRADAQENWERLKPFAVMERIIFGGYNEVYAEAMTKRRVMVFGASTAIPNSYYRRYAPYIWSFWPDVEHWADQFTSYLCTKVAPFPVSHAGSGIPKGGPRKYALMWTTDRNWAGLTYFAQLIREGIKSCPNGAKFDIVQDNVTYSRNQYAEDTHPDAHTEARTNIAKMQGAKATTVLWLGGYDAAHTHASAEAGYYPEWVVAGDGYNDTLEHAQFQEQEVWRHAWVMTNNLREDKLEDSPCRRALREAEPRATRNEEIEACQQYRSFFTLFKAVQVAGPYLSPETVDQGQHAIPRSASASPFVAACFYDPGDFTCVKDAHEAWWDSDAPDPTGAPGVTGCYRMVREGQRYLAGEWEGGDDVFANPSDPCNTVNRDPAIHPYGPT